MESKDIVLYRGAEIDRFFSMLDQVRNGGAGILI